MDLKEYAKESRLQLKTLRLMARRGYISDPLTEDDLIGLRLLETVWRKRDIIRAQIVSFSKKERQRFIETVDFNTKWERYAYTRFKNLAKGKHLPMKKLFEEIELTFNFELKPRHRKRLYQIRQKVYDERKKHLSRSGDSRN